MARKTRHHFYVMYMVKDSEQFRTTQERDFAVKIAL